MCYISCRFLINICQLTEWKTKYWVNSRRRQSILNPKNLVAQKLDGERFLSLKTCYSVSPKIIPIYKTYLFYLPITNVFPSVSLVFNFMVSSIMQKFNFDALKFTNTFIICSWCLKSFLN